MKASEIFAVDGRIVIVTGAASGIGLTIAETLADNGAYVVLADVDQAGLDQAAAAISASGGKVEALVLDVTDPAGVASAFRGIAERLGRIDVVFANAGVSAGPGYGNPIGALDALDFELFERANRVNLTGAIATMTAAARIMKAQSAGSIIVTTSAAAFSNSRLPGYGYYAAKAGLAQVVKVAAAEMAQHNVRVNAIAPGAFPTNMAGGRLREPGGGAAFAAEAMIQRVARMEEIAGAALLLASEASSYMTGTTLHVDGGVAAT
ncbi:SDR family NAD(P)-dependent oxidoreductase [Blastomonas fulva]|uniref:SDR family NAD(P)-dependent oxidoreductase n=1 Tax=Blastomonas fulva TaxID=1550728 RepID=UPI003F70A30D